MPQLLFVRALPRTESISMRSHFPSHCTLPWCAPRPRHLAPRPCRLHSSRCSSCPPTLGRRQGEAAWQHWFNLLQHPPVPSSDPLPGHMRASSTATFSWFWLTIAPAASTMRVPPLYGLMLALSPPPPPSTPLYRRHSPPFPPTTLALRSYGSLAQTGHLHPAGSWTYNCDMSHATSTPTNPSIWATLGIQWTTPHPTTPGLLAHTPAPTSAPSASTLPSRGDGFHESCMPHGLYRGAQLKPYSPR